MNNLITPNWPAPVNVHAFFTTREGGLSESPYKSLNLGRHVGDAAETVDSNRALLPLPAEPFWLEQVHSSRCLNVDHLTEESDVRADASLTQQSGRVLAVMVADCLPILLSSKTGKVVAVIHAGWRGLANGVIEETLDCQKDEEWIAWIGPAIGPCHYEVKHDVLDHFETADGFVKKSDETWSMDLAAIAAAQFRRLGVLEIYGGGYCTYCDEEKFFSYRRDGETGRMAGFIWLD